MVKSGLCNMHKNIVYASLTHWFMPELKNTKDTWSALITNMTSISFKY
jgi:hypothetical protein